MNKSAYIEACRMANDMERTSERHAEGVEIPFRLIDLPPEIIRKIYDVFSPDVPTPCQTFRDYEDAQKALVDVVNMARSCKALYTIAVPFLRKYGRHPLQQGLLHYVSSILSSEPLAFYETTFRFTPNDRRRPYFEDIALPREVPLEQWNRFLPYILIHRAVWGQMGVNLEGDIGPLLSREELAFIAIASFWNLSSLTLCSAPLSLAFAHRLVVELPALRRIKLIGQVGYLNSVDMGSYSGYINGSRNLLVVKADNMERCSKRLQLYKAHTISLTRCRLEPWNTEGVLSGIGPLRIFVYRTGNYQIYLGREPIPKPGSRNEVDAAEIVNRLSRSGASFCLEFLEIDLREPKYQRSNFESAAFVDREDRVKMRMPFMPTLRDYGALRAIRLTQQTIWEHSFYHMAFSGRYDGSGECMHATTRLLNLLPPSLKFFSLYDITAAFLPSLVRFAKEVSKRNIIPELKSINLRPSPSLARQFAHARAHLDDPSLPRDGYDYGHGYYYNYGGENDNADYDTYTENDDTDSTRPCCADTDTSCAAACWAMARRAQALRLLKEVERRSVEFKADPYPLSTEDEEALRRQGELQHWCEECHFDAQVCYKRDDVAENM